MLELFGIQLGTPFQAGTLLTVLVVALVWWIRGIPDRGRVRNEGRAQDATVDAEKRREWRAEIHAIKNELTKVTAELVKCNRTASSAVVLNEQMMFLFELMLSEQEDSHPESKIVQRARLMFNRISTELKDPSKSDALTTAEIAVEDAAQTLASTKETRAEVKRAENGK